MGKHDIEIPVEFENVVELWVAIDLGLSSLW